jgi:hypothetical protein
MKRKIPYLAASCAELARFVMLMILARDFGAIDGAGGFPRLVRYAAAPQLLFAAGFFFLWLDAPRYRQYRPLLAVGKLAGLISLAPLAGEILYARFEHSAQMRDPRAAFVHVLFLAAVDIGSLAIALLCAMPEASAPALRDDQEGAMPAKSETAESVEIKIPPAREDSGKVGG